MTNGLNSNFNDEPGIYNEHYIIMGGLSLAMVEKFQNKLLLRRICSHSERLGDYNYDNS